jgi:glycosyltransferase involved in cell wall biosynthesis
MRVLYVSHTGILGGGEMSLLELLRGLPEEMAPLVACPDGELASILRAEGVPVRDAPALEASLRLHPVHTSRGLVDLARVGAAVRRAARDHGAEVVHANSIRAGLAATAGTARGGPPVLVHVRDCLPDSRPANIARRVIAHSADRVLAVSRFTADDFLGGRPSNGVDVIYGPIDLERFDPARVDSAGVRRELGIPAEATVLCVTGQITPWKGQSTAIEAMSLLDEQAGDVRLLIVGSVKFAGASTRYANTEYQRLLERMVTERGLVGKVFFMGERRDIPELMGAADVLLAPSWEEPFGRSVVEAMAMQTAVIATNAGGPAEVIEDRVSGRLLDPHDSQAWSHVVEELVRDPQLRARLGANARVAAMSFGISAHVDRVLAAYREVASSTRANADDQRRSAASDRISA